MVKQAFPIKRSMLAAVLVLGFGVSIATYVVAQMRDVGAGYRAAIESQATASFVLANANRFLVSERDDIVEMLVDNTAAGSAAYLALLHFDQANFAQSLSRAAALVPEHADGIARLQLQADQVIGGHCQRTILLGSVATEDAAIIASQHIYLAECAPYFPAVVKAVNAMQDRLRNQRNAQIEALIAATDQKIHMAFAVIVAGFVALLIVLIWIFRTATGTRPADSEASNLSSVAVK